MYLAAGWDLKYQLSLIDKISFILDERHQNRAILPWVSAITKFLSKSEKIIKIQNISVNFSSERAQNS